MAARTKPKPAGYDATLKNLLTSLTGPAFRLLTGEDRVVRWRSVDLPDSRSLLVDLLGETADGRLLHIELQSTNDTGMALRMLEYSLGVRRAFGQFPVQVVLYFGQSPMTMRNHTVGAGLRHEFRIVDARDIDGAALLASGRIEDNVIAILTRLADRRGAIRGILKRIAEGRPERREKAIRSLGIPAGLRKLGEIIKEEAEAMPILDDMMDHDLLGPKLTEGIAIGLRRGMEKGLNHERHTLRKQIEKRFGRVPRGIDERLKAMSPEQLESVALRLFDAGSVKELFN